MKTNDPSEIKQKLPGSIWRALAIALPMGLAAPLAWYTGVQIIRYGGSWWIPLMIAFIVLLQLPVVWWISRRDKDNYHAQVGHEAYYEDYPEELRRALKQARREGIDPAVREKLEDLRSRPDPSPAVPDPVFEKKRRVRAAVLYADAGLTALMGLFLLLNALPLPAGLFAPGSGKTDYTSVFLLVSGAMVLVTAVGILLRKTMRRIRFSTAVLLAVTVWATLLSATQRLRFTMTDLLLHLGCLAVYLLAAFVIPARVGDIRGAEQIRKDRREYRLALFELGYITEDQLSDGF